MEHAAEDAFLNMFADSFRHRVVARSDNAEWCGLNCLIYELALFFFGGQKRKNLSKEIPATLLRPRADPVWQAGRNFKPG